MNDGSLRSPAIRGQAADSDEEAVAVIADEFDFVLEPIAGEKICCSFLPACS